MIHRSKPSKTLWGPHWPKIEIQNNFYETHLSFLNRNGPKLKFLILELDQNFRLLCWNKILFSNTRVESKFKFLTHELNQKFKFDLKLKLDQYSIFWLSSWIKIGLKLHQNSVFRYSWSKFFFPDTSWIKIRIFETPIEPKFKFLILELDVN